MRAEQCDCKCASHSHGERITYVMHRCRCEECRGAANRYERHRVRQQAYGRGALTDAEPVRAHIRALMGLGMGWKRVAETAGVSPSTVYPLLYGKYLDQPDHPEHRPPRRQILKVNAEKLLAVTYEPSRGTHVSATGARRRLQALACVGYSQSHLARLLDMEVVTVHLIISGHRTQIHHATHAAIAGVFEERWDVPPVNRGQVIARTINLARANGWVPAAAWDDIDSPREKPKGVAA